MRCKNGAAAELIAIVIGQETTPQTNIVDTPLRRLSRVVEQPL
jgi:hypothetical protein